MSTERDLLRDLLRDYAAERAVVPASSILHGPTIGVARVGSRVSLAIKAFKAVRNVLEVIERADDLGVKRVDVSGLRDAIRKGLT